MALLLASSSALAESKIGAELNANAGYTSNPFGVSGSQGDAGSGMASGSIAPTVTFLSPTGEISFNGMVRHTEYFKRYKSTTDYFVGSQIRQNLSEVTAITGSATYSSYVRNALYPVLDPSAPPGSDPDDPIIVDPAATVNFAQRTKTLSGNLALNTSLSARDSITLSARVAVLRLNQNFSALSTDSDSYGGAVSYRRAIGEDSSIGLSMDIGKIQYKEASFGDSTQYSPAILLRTQFAPRFTLDLSAGVTISQFERLTGSSSQTSFSGNANVCRDGDRTEFCLLISRQVQPSSIAGVSNLLSASVNYSYAFNERSTVRAAVAYSRSQSLRNGPSPLPGFSGLQTDYGFASASYDYRIRERLSAVVSISYSDSFDQIVARPSNFSGTVGVKYRLGEL